MIDVETEEKEDKAPRHRPQRGLGSVVTRKRRIQAEALEKQINDRLAAERNAARNEIARLKNRNEGSIKGSDDKWATNLLRSVVSGQTAVMRSLGLTQGVTSQMHPSSTVVNAWTDFHKISVTWPKQSLPNRMDRTEVLDTIAQMKGVMQHEIGHLRFTTSFKTIKDKAPAKGGHPEGLVFKCWNMLEDMRMETLVVESVPRIANYFGTMVANVVLNGGNLPIEQTWIMLAGREYLPKAVLRKSYEMFDQFCFDQGISNGAGTWYGLVQDYKAATTERQIMDAVEAAYEFIQTVRATMPEAGDDHDPMKNNENEADVADTGRGRGSILDMFDEKPKPPGKKNKSEEEGGGGGSPSDEPGEGDGEGDEEGEGSGKGNGDPKDKGDRGQSDHGDGSETPTTESGILEEMLKETVSQYQETTRKDWDVQEAARGANMAADSDGLDEYPHEGPGMSFDLTRQAQYTALGIEEALNTFVTDASPTWQYRKDKGIIDALAYRTKNVGDRDFRRHLEDYGTSGLNVHVSMLCDVSGSMSGQPIVALSEALYATALACQRLDIGATYTLWSSDRQNYRVWGNGKPTPTLWPAMGGTDPTQALDDLDSHNPEAADNHLVVIFTDGAWSYNFPSLQRWAAPGRTFVLVRYGAYDGEMQKDMGADKHIGINDVRQLPAELTNALIDVLADQSGW